MNMSKRWDRFVAQLEALDSYVMCNRLQLENLAAVERFDLEHGNTLPKIEPAYIARIMARQKDISDRVDKLKKCQAGVLVRTLGVRPRADGDFDIVAPTSMPKEQVAQYQLDGLPLLILIGVVCVAGVTGIMYYLEKENLELKQKYDKIYNYADKRFSKNKSTSEDWAKFKGEEHITERLSVSQKLKREADRLWKATKTAGKAGAIVAAAALGLWIVGSAFDLQERAAS